MTRERADGQPGVRDRLPELVCPLRIVEQNIRFEVIVPRPAARAQLDRLDLAERFHLQEHLGRRQFPEHRRE
jgi:hypothetical protein